MQKEAFLDWRGIWPRLTFLDVNRGTRRVHQPLPWYSDPGNLAAFPRLHHTRLTYHRTWETGLGAGTKVTAANPAFFCPRSYSVTASGGASSARIKQRVIISLAKREI
jgi:hypothetical protein